MTNPLKTLQTDPIKYTNEKIKYYDRAWLTYRILFIVISILIAFCAIASALLTAFIVYYTKGSGKGHSPDPKPPWYFYAETSLSAAIAMFASIINFFFIKNKYIIASKKKHAIHAEIILLNNKIGDYKLSNKNRIYDFYNNISKICGTYNKSTKDYKLVKKVVKK